MSASAVYSILLKKENAHEDPIYCCAWAKIKPAKDSWEPAKDFIVTGSLDSHVKVWHLENNKLEPLHTLAGHIMGVVSVAVSPDGHTIASTSLDCSLIIWDLISGNKVHDILEAGVTDSWQVTFSPDGMQVVTGCHTGKLIIFGIEHGNKHKVLDTRGQFALSVAWSPDGKYISSGAADGSVCVFDVAQGKLLHTVEAHAAPVRSVAFSHNSQLLVTASNDGRVKVYKVASANLLNTLEHKMWVLDARASADGSRVATGAADGGVRVALVDGMRVLHTFREHTDTVWGVQFNAESNKLLSVSKDQSIIIYECPVLPKAAAKK